MAEWECVMQKTIIVMPVANEGDTMADVLDRILRLPYTDLYVYPVVDSYSKDNTEQIIREYEKKSDKVKCIFYKESTGVISCYFEGFRQAIEDGAQCIIEMDGGGSHQPEEIPLFIDKLEEGYDCVWGSRFVDGGGFANHPLYRRLLSSGGTLLANLVLGTKLKDMTSGFEAFKKEILEEMDLAAFLSKGHMYQTEMRYYCRNYNTVEVPIHYIGSTSELKAKSVKDALEILFQLKRHEKKVCKALSA